MPKHLIDVSHTVEDGMITYKGFPAPVICDWLSREASRAKYAAGTEFQIGKIEMIANTGTYIDSAFHRYERPCLRRAGQGQGPRDLPRSRVCVGLRPVGGRPSLRLH